MEPVIALALFGSAALYGAGLRALWHHAPPGRGIRRWEAAAFAAGWAALAVAFFSPLDELGHELFSAHMLQHELLMAVAAPLLVLGRPLLPFLWGLPIGARRALGAWAGAGPVVTVWSALSRPSIAWLLHATAVWVWHLPRFYDAAVRSDAIHALQHVSFLATGLLFWWALLHGRRARIRYGSAVLYLFGMTVQMTALGALLALSARPLYPVYAHTLRWSLTALEDQQLAGLLMWIPGGLPYLIAALLLASAWLRESDRARGRRGIGVPVGSALALLLLLASCDRESDIRSAALLTGGNPERGRELVHGYGCGSCHSIPGVRGADALVGPPLAGIANRSYIAGVLVNQPDNLIRWIRNPQAVDSQTAMPNLGVGEQDARDIAGYLYTLR